MKTVTTTKVILPTDTRPEWSGTKARDFRGRLAEGFARGVYTPEVSEGALKNRLALFAEIDGARISTYDIGAEVWETFDTSSRRKGSVNDAPTARVWPKGKNVDSNSAATSLRRYFDVFAFDMPEDLRIVTIDDVRPVVTFVRVKGS